MKDSILANKALSLTIESAHVKEFGKFLLVESRIQLRKFNPVKD